MAIDINPQTAPETPENFKKRDQAIPEQLETDGGSGDNNSPNILIDNPNTSRRGFLFGLIGGGIALAAGGVLVGRSLGEKPSSASTETATTEAPRPTETTASPSSETQAPTETEASSEFDLPSGQKTPEGMRALYEKGEQALVDFATLPISLMNNPQKLVERYYAILNSFAGAGVTEKDLADYANSQDVFIDFWLKNYGNTYIERIDPKNTVDTVVTSAGEGLSGLNALLRIQKGIIVAITGHGINIEPLYLDNTEISVIETYTSSDKSSITITYGHTAKSSLTSEQINDVLPEGSSVDLSNFLDYREYATTFVVNPNSNSLQIQEQRLR